MTRKELCWKFKSKNQSHNAWKAAETKFGRDDRNVSFFNILADGFAMICLVREDEEYVRSIQKFGEEQGWIPGSVHQSIIDYLWTRRVKNILEAGGNQTSEGVNDVISLKSTQEKF